MKRRTDIPADALRRMGLDEASRNGSAPWPTLAEEARYGLAGDILAAIEPHTEADPVAVLTNILIAFGNAAERGPHVKVGDDRHGLNLYAVLVGESAKGCKGMSWNYAKNLMHTADPFWVEDRIVGGLNSGEGLINAVRDPVTSVNKSGDVIVVDEGGLRRAPTTHRKRVRWAAKAHDPRGQHPVDPHPAGMGW